MIEDNFLEATRVFVKTAGYRSGRSCKYCIFNEDDKNCARVNCEESLISPSGTIKLSYIWINKKDRTI